jgi:hypothetical protein
MSFKFQISNFKFIVLSVFVFCIPIMAQNKSCKFDEKTLQFVGKPVEQARCLLRPNKIGGVLGDELKELPKPIESLIGVTVKIKKESLRKYLQKKKLKKKQSAEIWINLWQTLNYRMAN